MEIQQIFTKGCLVFRADIIDCSQCDRTAVDGNSVIGELDITESNFECGIIGKTTFVLDTQRYGVEFGALMTPRFDVRDVLEKAYGILESHFETGVAFT